MWVGREPDSGQGPSGLLKICPFAAGRNEVRLTNGVGVYRLRGCWGVQAQGKRRPLLFIFQTPTLPCSGRTEIRPAELTEKKKIFFLLFLITQVKRDFIFSLLELHSFHVIIKASIY